MSSLFGKVARKTGLYSALRYSWIYTVIQRFRNPEHLRKLNEEEVFYRTLLAGRNVELIFDVGANVGDKAEVFSRIARRVICFEPDPRLAEHLRRRFRGCSRLVVEQCGVSDREGIAELHAYDGGSAYNTFNQRQHELVTGEHLQHELIQVPLVTLDGMISRYGRPDFIKIDVEGHEREVLAGLSKAVPLLSYEANLPAFSEETCDVARRVVEIMGPGVAFAVVGSGYQMTGEYPHGVDSLCALIMKPDAPSYLEVFARLTNGAGSV
jgi:FkbM family methyltransferase